MKILLIDDDPYYLESLSMNLDLRGYSTTELTDPGKALEEYRTGEYDLVISDYNMPGMTGLEVLKKIRSFDPDARIVFITADNDIEHIIEALNNQAYAYFLKPVDMDRVAVTLAKAENEQVSANHR